MAHGRDEAIESSPHLAKVFSPYSGRVGEYPVGHLLPQSCQLFFCPAACGTFPDGHDVPASRIELSVDAIVTSLIPANFRCPKLTIAFWPLK